MAVVKGLYQVADNLRINKQIDLFNDFVQEATKTALDNPESPREAVKKVAERYFKKLTYFLVYKLGYDKRITKFFQLQMIGGGANILEENGLVAVSFTSGISGNVPVLNIQNTFVALGNLNKPIKGDLKSFVDEKKTFNVADVALHIVNIFHKLTSNVQIVGTPQGGKITQKYAFDYDYFILNIARYYYDVFQDTLNKNGKGTDWVEAHKILAGNIYGSLINYEKRHSRQYGGSGFIAQLFDLSYNPPVEKDGVTYISGQIKGLNGLNYVIALKVQGDTLLSIALQAFDGKVTSEMDKAFIITPENKESLNLRDIKILSLKVLLHLTSVIQLPPIKQ